MVGDPELILQELSNELMSPYCPGRTIAACPSPNARKLEDRAGSREQLRAVLRAAAEAFESGGGDELEPAQARQALKEAQRGAAAALGVKKVVPAAVMQPVRWAVTGSLTGAELPESIALLGRGRTAERIRFAADEALKQE